MRRIERGIACAGCPHRAAYVVCKEALGRGRAKVICGNAGCAAVGAMHPAATVCPGGEPALLDRYRQPVPTGGSAEEPAAEVCIHFVLADEVFADDAAERFGDLAAEGRVTVLAVLASGRDFLKREAVENLGRQALELGAQDAVVADPLDTLGAGAVMESLLARPGVHAVIFTSPCAQLQAKAPLEPVEVDRYGCVGCHRCKQITGCPALTFAPPAYRVDPEACAGCDLCTAYCRTHVIYSPRTRLEPQARRALRLEATGA